MSTLTTLSRRAGMSRSSANLILLLVAMSWGLSYVLLKMAATTFPPFEVLAIRFSLSSIICVGVFWRRLRTMTRRALRYGVILGAMMFLCSSALIFGETTTEASTASFLTSSAIVFVPVMQAIRKRRLPERKIILGTLCAMTGIALLSLKDGLALSSGASLCIVGALLYAVYIIATGEMVQREDALLLGVIQQIVMAVIGWVSTFTLTTPVFPQAGEDWMLLLILALCCGAFPFVAQPFAQRFTSPEHTALILSLEPVFGALFAMAILAEWLTFQAYVGAFLVMASVLLSSYRKTAKKK